MSRECFYSGFCEDSNFLNVVWVHRSALSSALSSAREQVVVSCHSCTYHASLPS